MLDATIAGSLPKPAWLATPNALWAPWRLDGAALEEGKRDAVRLVLRDQEEAGIDIVTEASRRGATSSGDSSSSSTAWIFRRWSRSASARTATRLTCRR